MNELKVKKSELKTSVQEITQVFSESLKKWREEEPRKDKGEKLFYCPICSHTMTETYYIFKKYGRPKCPMCNIEMADFDRNRFRELRQKLADEALPIVPRVVEALLEVVAVHGFTDPLLVRIDGGELRIKPDLTPNEFRYNASAKRLEAFYYYYDAPQHVESLKALIKAALRLGLGILVRIYPDHKKMPLPYDNLPISYDVFNGYEIKINARGCRFLAEVVLADDAGFLPERLRKVLRDFAYAYAPHLHITAIICRRSEEVSITLIHDSDAVYDACVRACAHAARSWLSWVDAIDAVDVCRRECRSAVNELIKQDVKAGVRRLRDLLGSAGIAHVVDVKTDIGAVVRLWP